MKPQVKVSRINKKFGDVIAVDDVSFEVYPGEIFGLLGPNGAGKTTTIRMMLDIFRPDRGYVSIFGGRMDEGKKDRIGYLPEERGLYKDIKLEHTLIFLATLKGMSKTDAREKLKIWLERFDLYDHRHKKIQDLSRGMQQKAQFIASLIHEPELIVIDEPFLGLDPVNTRLVKQIILDQIGSGVSVVMSTHQMHQVEAMCNRIVLINEGRAVLHGKVDQIKKDYSGNAIFLRGYGHLGKLPGVIEVRQENNDYHLVLENDASPQDIYRSIAKIDKFNVERFEIAETSFDDIFISVVQGDKESGITNG